jgi:hypothetical protein
MSKLSISSDKYICKTKVGFNTAEFPFFGPRKIMPKRQTPDQSFLPPKAQQIWGSFSNRAKA